MPEIMNIQNSLNEIRANLGGSEMRKPKNISDIFKPEKLEEISIVKPLIIADNREKNSLVISELIHAGAEVRFEQLQVADFLINNTAIERKTISDFLLSMTNKRLSEQLINMQQYDSRLLIIEGLDEQEIYSEEREMNPNAVRGFLLDILLKYKVPIITTKSYEDTAKFLLVLAKKRDRSESLRAKRKVKSAEEQKQFILEGFPGIGPNTAKKLLKEYGSIKKIVNAPKDELDHSIGKKANPFITLLE